MVHKPVSIAWWIAPPAFLALSLVFAWRVIAWRHALAWQHGSIGVLDAFRPTGKPADYAVAKAALIGAGLMLTGIIALFLNRRTRGGVVLAALVGASSALFIAIGVTAYTDLAGQDGDARGFFLGMPMYVLGAVSTLILCVQVARSAPTDR